MCIRAGAPLPCNRPPVASREARLWRNCTFRPLGRLVRQRSPGRSHAVFALLSPLLRLAVVVCLTASLVFARPPAGADVNARQLTAATIVSLLRLVVWRTPATGPLTVTVVGDAALAEALRDAAHGQRVDGRVVTVSKVDALLDVRSPWPAVVVLASSQRATAATAARLLEPQGVLTVGDGDGMSQAGLVLGVYVAGDRMRFDANTGAAARAGLTLSSHLLRLARIVG